MIYEMSPVTTMLDSLLNVPLTTRWMFIAFILMNGTPTEKKLLFWKFDPSVLLPIFSRFGFFHFRFSLSTLLQIFSVFCVSVTGDRRNRNRNSGWIGASVQFRKFYGSSKMEEMNFQFHSKLSKVVSCGGVEPKIWVRVPLDIWLFITFCSGLNQGCYLPRCWASLSCDCFYKGTIVKYNPFLVVLLLNFLMSVVS